MTILEEARSRDMVIQPRSAPTQRDYTKCDVCGIPLEPDRMHVMIDNGNFIKNLFVCRRHRYVQVEFAGKTFVQERTDRELDHLSNQFRNGQLPEGWE